MKEIGDKKYYSHDEFNQFNWAAIQEGKYATNGENYNFCKGGRGNPNGEGWKINIYLEGHKTEIWELPSALSRFIDWSIDHHTKEGERKITNQIKDILKLN